MKSRQKGKKKGSSKERVFGCDLQEHLQHSGQEVPQVLRSCAEFVEEYGVVDGIYRLSGVSSNIQKLRQEFEAERKPDLRRDVYLQDIHCVSSLCKAYFRELPDPLLTYRLYDKFAEAVAVQLEPERLVKILEVLRELPVPNYRTLEFLMRHLVHMASLSAQTNMHARNLAIVWAPNLLRSKDIEASGFNGTAAFMEVRVQSIVVEFILTHVDQLFEGAALSGGEVESGWRSLPGVRVSGSPEDLMPRSLPYHLPSILQSGDGPPQMRPYHTIIEIAEHKKGSLKVRKWRSIFNLGRSGHETKRKLPRGAEDREDKSDKVTLRPAKSMDSLSAVAGVSDEPEGLVGRSSPRPCPLLLASLENDSVEAAEGEQEPEAEALAGTSSEPGTPRPGRSAIRAGGSSHAERRAGVHISEPYDVNLPPHISSMLNISPNIISNVSLAGFARGLEYPTLQSRPSPASGPGSGPGLGPGPPDEKLEASPAPGPLADSGPADMTPALEDCLSQEVQDSFSFLEDSSSSEPEWVGVVDGEVAKAGPAGAAFSPGEDDPGMGYLEELLGVGPQVEEFSVEPPLDDLSLDEAQFVLAPSCCSLDSPGSGPEAEEESGEEVFLSAYDDLSPLLGPKLPTWEGSGSLEEKGTGSGRQEAPGQAEGEQVFWEVEEGKEAEPGIRRDIREEAEGSPESGVEGGEASEEGVEAEGSQKVIDSLSERCGEEREETEAKGEESKGQQEDESTEEAKGVEETGGEQGKERKTEREEEEEGDEAQGEAGRDPEDGAQENQIAEESWEVVHKQEAEGGREDEVKGQRGDENQEAREDQGDGEDSRIPEAAAEGGAGKVSKERECGDGEDEGDQRAGGDHVEEGSLPEMPHVESLEVDSAKEGNAQPSETEHAAPQPPRPEEMDPEGQPSPLGSAGGVSMRLASTLVQVQQVRSVPVVPPKPQFAKMPSAMCGKIHVAPANPCPRPGRLDGTPGERAWGSRASRSSWRNGGSLSFDAAVALARDRQRTEAQAVRRTQTCTGAGDYSLIPKTSPYSMISAYCPRPLSCLELPAEGTEGSGPRSRFSLPPREPQLPDPVESPQRRSYAFETQANSGKGEGL
ncbi:rho GTPase-activating protein 30 isoform X2 [Lagenorhynchus albirostris]|uniref:rho GTPase-activating protein 30 isoform X2 n=1 Tax=Lagenorhynchus albirostris TaxID=27610 RepID=UPI0028ED598F|nr:rho GTPase-activating protein 30 isoform X2 [Lagenorhynchus albirostris]